MESKPFGTPSVARCWEAIQYSVDKGHQALLEEMCREWPFFSTRLGMLEMVYTKCNLDVSRYYDQRLVEPALRPLGDRLRDQLQKTSKRYSMLKIMRT